MDKTFDYMKRGAELVESGVSDEEMVDILEREQDEAEFVALGSGYWNELAARFADEAEREYQMSLR